MKKCENNYNLIVYGDDDEVMFIGRFEKWMENLSDFE